MPPTTREPYHRGACECGRPPGQCVKGDLDRCPTEDELDDELTEVETTLVGD